MRDWAACAHRGAETPVEPGPLFAEIAAPTQKTSPSPRAKTKPGRPAFLQFAYHGSPRCWLPKLYFYFLDQVSHQVRHKRVNHGGGLVVEDRLWLRRQGSSNGHRSPHAGGKVRWQAL